MFKFKIATCAIFLTLITLACGFTKAEEASIQTTITSPPNGTNVLLGDAIEIISFSSADGGILKVELKINGQEISTDFPSSGSPTQFTAIQSWTPIITGEVVVSVVAYDSQGKSSAEAEISLLIIEQISEVDDNESQADDTPSPEINVEALTPTESIPPTPTETLKLIETSTLTPTDSPPVDDEAGCTLDSGFVSDITIPDNTELAPNTTFLKTWRLNNDGTCNWSPGTILVFVSGDQMSGETTIAVPSIAPGEIVDLSVNLTSPNSSGIYKGSWRLHTNEGVAFGTTPHVQIIVPEVDNGGDGAVILPDPGLIFPGIVLAPTLETVYQQINILAGEVGYIAATCPDETMIVSGGFAGSSDLYVYNQSKQANGWTVYAKNNASSNKLLNSYANCLRYAVGNVTQEVVQVTTSGGGVGHPVATCPLGTIVTGGGWAAQSDGSFHIYNSSKSGNGWQIYANNLSGSNKLINAYAICLSDTAFITEQLLIQETIPGNNSDGVTSSCAGIGLAVGGGFAGNSELYIFNSSLKSGTIDQWNVYARNFSGTSNLLNSYVICLSSP